MNIPREVLLAGLRTYMDHMCPAVSEQKREEMIRRAFDGESFRGRAVVAGIVAAIEAWEAAPVPWGPDPEIPAQRVPEVTS